MTSRPRAVIAGLGDTGVLTAIHLAPDFDVVGIATKPGLVSGQELGQRLARPDEWQRAYRIGFDRFHRLRGARIVHGSATGLDLDARVVRVKGADGSIQDEPYDVLVIATGVANGFWRTPLVEHDADVAMTLASAHGQLSEAGSVAVVGGGAAAVSSAWNIAAEWPDKQVDLYFPGERALPGHHPRVWRRLQHRFEQRGVGLHAGHRAIVPDGFSGESITSAPIQWSTGQPETTADAVLWAIGRVRPNSDWLPAELLDADGFVVVDEHLRVPGIDGVYAIGDIAATDPLRTSARARADRLLARNIRADLTGGRATRFQPLTHRWGSVVGVQGNVLEVFSPTGRSWRIPAWESLRPWLVDRGIYKGIRADD